MRLERLGQACQKACRKGITCPHPCAEAVTWRMDQGATTACTDLFAAGSAVGHNEAQLLQEHSPGTLDKQPRTARACRLATLRAACSGGRQDTWPASPPLHALRSRGRSRWIPGSPQHLDRSVGGAARAGCAPVKLVTSGALTRRSAGNYLETVERTHVQFGGSLLRSVRPL